MRCLNNNNSTNPESCLPNSRPVITFARGHFRETIKNSETEINRFGTSREFICYAASCIIFIHLSYSDIVVWSCYEFGVNSIFIVKSVCSGPVQITSHPMFGIMAPPQREALEVKPMGLFHPHDRQPTWDYHIGLCLLRRSIPVSRRPAIDDRSPLTTITFACVTAKNSCGWELLRLMWEPTCVQHADECIRPLCAF